MTARPRKRTSRPQRGKTPSGADLAPDEPAEVDQDRIVEDAPDADETDSVEDSTDKDSAETGTAQEDPAEKDPVQKDPVQKGEAAEADDTETGSVEDVLDDDPPRRRAARRPRPSPRRLDLSPSTIDVRGLFTTVRDGVRTLVGKPLASFHIVLSLSVILTVLGLIMVLSASSVEGYALDGSAYGMFVTQLIFAILGFFVFYVTLKTPIRYFRRFATVGIMGSILLLLLVLVPGIGVSVYGARRWFNIAGLSVQPSELVKVALCVWGAHLLASRRSVGAYGKELLMPLLPVGLVICALIILEPNQSTTMIIALIVASLLWFAGVPGRVFGAFIVALGAIGVALAMMSDYRAARVFSFLSGGSDPLGSGYQATQAEYALANGGVFGVGLGQSTAKWNYLPNAHNDFIFAIIAEELGLVGALTVVALFLLLGWVGMRIARRSVDPFLRLLSATITVLFLVQAFINIGYVIGLLPVTGIQLPILSNGGTSMLTMLAMLGLLATAARHEPDAVRSLHAAGKTRRSGVARLLALPVPETYRPARAVVLRDRLERRRTASGAAGRRPASDRRRRRPAPSGQAEPGRSRVRASASRRSGEIHYPGGEPAASRRHSSRASAPRASAAGPDRRWRPPTQSTRRQQWPSDDAPTRDGFRRDRPRRPNEGETRRR